MKVDFGQGEVECDVSMWTLVVYEQEFSTRDHRADMIQDLFGEEVVRASDADVDEDVIWKFDYRDFNWVAATKALWAALKAHDPSTPGYEQWAKTIGDVNLMDVIAAFVPEVRKRLFRSSADSEEEDGAEVEE